MTVAGDLPSVVERAISLPVRTSRRCVGNRSRTMLFWQGGL